MGVGLGLIFEASMPWEKEGEAILGSAAYNIVAFQRECGYGGDGGRYGGTERAHCMLSGHGSVQRNPDRTPQPSER